MKLLQFKRHNETSLGVKTNRGILDVKEASNYFQIYTPTNMHALILAEEEGMQALRSLVEVASTNYALFYNENEMDFTPVIHNPDKIICVGLNYVPHVEESKMKIPESPVLFSKFNNTLAAHKEEISLPNIAEKYDYEAELVIVIGKKAYQINEEEALSYVFGYTVGNDLSARDLQFNSSQWLLGKTLNQFGPVGPYVVTADEIDPSNVK